MGANPFIFIIMKPGCNLLESTVFPAEKICMVRGKQSNRKQTLVCSLEAKGCSSAVMQLPQPRVSDQLSPCISWSPAAHP